MMTYTTINATLEWLNPIKQSLSKRAQNNTFTRLRMAFIVGACHACIL